MLTQLKSDIQKLADPKKAKIYQRFFKTDKGQYGEGDVFLGLRVPQIHDIAKKYVSVSLADLKKLITSKYHEYRLTALLILVYKFPKSNTVEQKKIYQFYLANTAYINNWDLIDLSAPKIVGAYLLNKDHKILYRLARSKNLWERRISVLSCFRFIRENDFTDAIIISTMLLSDPHNLIHKATGWMLREIGKRDLKTLIKFLDKHTLDMPRTMLRYAIEKLTDEQRQYYLKKK